MKYAVMIKASAMAYYRMIKHSQLQSTRFFLSMTIIFLNSLGCKQEAGIIIASQPSLFAVNSSQVQLRLYGADQFVRPLSELVTIERFSATEMVLSSNGLIGRITIRSQLGAKLVLSIDEISTDRDDDGFPDILELSSAQERDKFRTRFVQIAEAQVLKPSAAWQSAQRDCSGLIRFAYRFALGRGSQKIIQERGFEALALLPAVSVPLVSHKKLQDGLFRVEPGGYQGKDQFAEFADAEHLLKYNTKYIQHQLDGLSAGDLLFFYDEERSNFPYHSMIVTKTSPHMEFIYHTGSLSGMKKVKLSYLQNKPRFYPSKSNPHYLGAYRLKILD